MLRNVIKSKLPVEIYHYEGEFSDEKLRKEFIDDYGVTLVQSSAKKTEGKAWQIKNAAFVDTKFTQFVYMDSDNIPLSDPAELFDSVEFKQGGSVFWPDLNKDHPKNAIWRVLGRDCSDEHWPAESGQVLFDKSGNNGLNLAVLHMSNHMMLESDFYGDLGYGDKDTYVSTLQAASDESSWPSAQSSGQEVEERQRLLRATRGPDLPFCPTSASRCWNFPKLTSSATRSTPSACRTRCLRACSRLWAGTSVWTRGPIPTSSAATRCCSGP